MVTHESTDPKHSYAVCDDLERVQYIVEKKPVSKNALVGIHYWQRGALFVKSADVSFEEMRYVEDRECYISETYNRLIEEDKAVVVYKLPPNQYIPLGTPYDVAIYEAKLKENNPNKPRTLFIDIDGTILKHLHRFSDVAGTTPELLPGVLAKVNEWDSHGHQIVFCTARKESARAITEQQLRILGLCWDQLIMGLTSGPRVLVNDRLSEEAPPRAISVNLVKDKGFVGTDWGSIGL